MAAPTPTDAVQLVNYQTPLDAQEDSFGGAVNLANPAAAAVELLPPVRADAGAAEPDAGQPAEAVQLSDVIAAVYTFYPGIEAARRERQIAAGEALEAMGAFDTHLSGEALSKALGFYENYRYDLSVKQYTWGGGQIFSGYRLGRGDFEPWYLERETNKGGELKAGFTLPFLRNRSIDKRRAAVFKARLQRAAAEPLVQLEVIDSIRAASIAYWDWVAAGRQLAIAREQYAIAVERQTKLARAVELGNVKGIELVDNERLIVSRQAKTIAAERKVQQAAIKLSIFLRSPDGMLLLPTGDQLPSDFPRAIDPDSTQLAAQIAQAVSLRPELRLLAFAAQQARVDVQQADNLLLPAVDGALIAGQDVGEPTSQKRDKSELELEAGLLVDVPLQRRAARGKLRAAQGKLAQLSAKRRLTEQKIAAEVRMAMTALEADYIQIHQARRSAELAARMEEAERLKFEQGDSNILLINLREQARAEARLLVVEAEVDYFRSLAELHAAIAGELAGADGPGLAATGVGAEATIEDNASDPANDRPPAPPAAELP